MAQLLDAELLRIRFVITVAQRETEGMVWEAIGEVPDGFTAEYFSNALGPSVISLSDQP